METAPGAAAGGCGLGAADGALALALSGLRLPSQRAQLAGPAGGQAVLDLSTLEEGIPQAFYLPDADLEELSDCFAVVGGGTWLPLHSQVLGAQSVVLRDLFRSQKEGGASAEVGAWGVQVVPAPGAQCLWLCMGRLYVALHGPAQTQQYESAALPGVAGTSH